MQERYGRLYLAFSGRQLEALQCNQSPVTIKIYITNTTTLQNVVISHVGCSKHDKYSSFACNTVNMLLSFMNVEYVKCMLSFECAHGK